MAQDREIRLELPELNRDKGDRSGVSGKCVVIFNTGKNYNGGISADATVGWSEGVFRTVPIGGRSSFMKRVSRSDARATQKAIDTLHAATFTPEAIAAIKAEILTHYGKAVTQ
jgi:hypothetical protein